MRSSIFVLAAAAGLAAATCNVESVSSCMMPIVSAAQTCSDVPCVCSNLDKELACYTNICPGQAIPAEATSAYNEVCTGSYATATFPAIATSDSDPFETSSEDSATPTLGSSDSTATDSGESTITSAPANGLGSKTTVGGDALDKPTITEGSAAASTESAASTSTAAADMLMIPAGGMIAGLVGALAWL